MKIVVTGAAGFIGSHLCTHLLQNPDHEVIGIDVFLNSGTPRWIRERNLQAIVPSSKFTFIEMDLLNVDWDSILPGVDIIYHLAGVPGVRSSWGADFKSYVANNIIVTQKLLEACRAYPIRKFIYSSTSSVYGEKTGRVPEDAITSPLSPYGVSKLSGEHLCRVYFQNDALPIVICRLFTVYGPRQRPDMAFHRFIKQILSGQPVQIYGDGRQSRDFTYVDDCVSALISAAYADGVIGETINIGGKERASVLKCIAMLEQTFGHQVSTEFIGQIYGEPQHTWADISKAQKLLHYDPKVDLVQGILKEMNDLQSLYSLKMG